MSEPAREVDMEHFTAHRLRFVAEVQNTVELNEH